MEGLDPNYRSALRGYVDEIIQLFSDHFSNQTKHLIPAHDYQSLVDEMAHLRTAVNEHFQSELSELLYTENVQRIMSVVEMLPKEELAEMAEALVNLTSFKRRVTPDAETVGGPIDQTQALLLARLELQVFRPGPQFPRRNNRNRRTTMSQQSKKPLQRKQSETRRRTNPPNENPQDLGRRAAREMFDRFVNTSKESN